MTSAPLPPSLSVQSWINKGTNPIPDWAQTRMIGRREANGTFMIHTRAGLDKVQARVLVGHIVIERKGILYTRPGGEARGLLEELDEKDSGAYAALPSTPRGPTATADHAPREDVTDDITRRLGGIVPQSAAKLPIDPARKTTASSRTAGQATAASGALKKWPIAKGNPPSIENRHPSELNLDDSYQRSTDNGASQALIKKIANGWDWRMCLPLVVSKRDDGSLWVLDGQHRLAAAILRGDIPFLPCVIGVYGSVADEAAMFVAMNRARKPMNRLDDFHAAIASGDSEAIEIAKLITDAGFTVSRRTGSQSWVAGEVAFTSAISKVLRKHGATVCQLALRTMQEAWPDEVLNAGSSMFTALTKLAVNPPDDFDHDRMFRALLKRDQKEWASFLNEVKGGGEERALALRRVLLMAYEEEGEAQP
ncbi:DUF6551 family protein [Sphingobium cupriresistens]|nr:DUF6551 family protein [Sphingobium cupriresistens]